MGKKKNKGSKAPIEPQGEESVNPPPPAQPQAQPAKPPPSQSKQKPQPPASKPPPADPQPSQPPPQAPSPVEQQQQPPPPSTSVWGKQGQGKPAGMGRGQAKQAPQQGQQAPQPVQQAPQQAPPSQSKPASWGPGPSSSSSSSSAPRPTPPAASQAKHPAPPAAAQSKPRPGEGKTHLITNMYSLNEASVMRIANNVHRYEIDVDDSSRKPSANLVRTLVYTIRRLDVFKQVPLFSDGSKIVYALKSLEAVVDAAALAQGVSELSIQAPPAAGKEPRQLPGRNEAGKGVHIDVAHPSSHRLYKVLMRPAGWNPEDDLQKSQMLQVAIKYSYYEQVREVIMRGGNLFLPAACTAIPNSDLLLFQGIFQSVRFNGFSKPILNVDLSYMVAMNSRLSIFQWIKGYAEHSGFRSLADALRNKNFVDALKYYLGGMLVKAEYGSNATYRLEGLQENLTPATVKFTNKEGKEVTLREYMQSTYQKTVDPHSVVLTAKMQALKPPKAEGGGGGEGSAASSSANKKKKAPTKATGGASTSRPTYLVSELFTFTPGQRRKGEMTSDERTQMINLTRQSPRDRFKQINEQIPHLVRNLTAQHVDIGIEQKRIEIDARVLQAKTLMYKTPVSIRNGGWDHSKFFSTAGQPVKWAIIHQNSQTVNDFVSNFQRICAELMLKVDKPEIINVGKKTFSETMKEHRNVQLFVCFLPFRPYESNLYEKIKYTSYVELGITSQCVVDESYKKKGQPWTKVLDRSVQLNLAASINAKLDAENYIVKEEEMQAIIGNPADVLVLGLDVFHGDTSDPEKKPSVIALCASKTRHFNKYTTALRLQHARQELAVIEDKDPEKAKYQVDNLSPMLDEVLKDRPKLPGRVIFYRDGVGEGMYDRVIDYEIRSLQQKLHAIYATAKLPAPKLTFIVVQKRNHLRSECTDANSRDGNPPPGTLVDNLLVIDGGQPNFYLYSHKALAGTARPTHYQLLLDENNLTKDQLAMFTYALTHLHQGCTKTVSIPAPVYYADLACGLAGTCFRNDVQHIQQQLRQTLYMI